MAQGSCRVQYGIYTTLQTARFQAEDIFKRLDKFTDAQVPNRALLKATVKAYGAYALLALGEGLLRDGDRRRATHDAEGSAAARGDTLHGGDRARDGREQPGHSEHGARGSGPR